MSTNLRVLDVSVTLGRHNGRAGFTADRRLLITAQGEIALTDFNTVPIETPPPHTLTTH